MVNVIVKSRSKSIKDYEETDFNLDSLLESLAKAIASKSKLNSNRIRLTYIDEKAKSKQVPFDLTKSITSSSYNVSGDITLYAKDLGPQISWKTVFFVEYLGPILIHPLFYYYYGQHNSTQTLSFYLVVLHFLKREFENEFVHKFSVASMPLSNLFKNCSHYWILSGVNLALFTYSPNALPENRVNALFVKKFLYYTNENSSLVNGILLAVWVFAEVSNLVTHLNLSSLRPAGTTVRKIPVGYGFDLVSCPNYFFETLGWLAFSLINGSPSAWLFFVVGAGQMVIWAVKKHKRYLKEFGASYPKSRKIFFPFLF